MGKSPYRTIEHELDFRITSHIDCLKLRQCLRVSLVILILGLILLVGPTSAGTIHAEKDQVSLSYKSEYSDQMLPKELQKQTIEIIQASDLTPVEKKILVRKLQDIWENKRNVYDREKEEVFQKAISVLNQQREPENPTVRWGGSDGWNPDGVHNYIHQRAGEGMGLESSYIYILNSYSLAPDTWGQLFTDHCWFVQGNPPNGGAPSKTKLYARNARFANGYNPGARDTYRYLSYSMHYMSDLSNPTHTEATLRSYFMHGLYEKYVANNWISGFRFKDTVRNHPNYFYKITDPELSAKNMAQLSNRYMDHLWEHYLDGNLETDPGIASDTRNNLRYAVAYDMGLIDYVLR